MNPIVKREESAIFQSLNPLVCFSFLFVILNPNLKDCIISWWAWAGLSLKIFKYWIGLNPNLKDCIISR
jgi:hypothetical protein